MVIWKQKTGFRYHYSSRPSKLFSLCGSPQLPPWYSNINRGYEPHTVVAKRDTTERPHTLKSARMIIQTAIAEGFLYEQIVAWEHFSVHTVLKRIFDSWGKV